MCALNLTHAGNYWFVLLLLDIFWLEVASGGYQALKGPSKASKKSSHLSIIKHSFPYFKPHAPHLLELGTSHGLWFQG